MWHSGELANKLTNHRQKQADSKNADGRTNMMCKALNVDVDVDMDDAKETAQQAVEAVESGVEQVLSFADAVQAKREQELKSEGWRSSAFDL